LKYILKVIDPTLVLGHNCTELKTRGGEYVIVLCVCVFVRVLMLHNSKSLEWIQTTLSG